MRTDVGDDEKLAARLGMENESEPTHCHPGVVTSLPFALRQEEAGRDRGASLQELQAVATCSRQS